MTALQRRYEHLPQGADAVEPAGALWRYAPARDPQGRPLCDFLMLVPGLRDVGERRDWWGAQLRGVLGDFGERVVFADLNLRLGLLWVTVQPQPGLSAEVAAAIQQRLPGSRVVGSYLQRPRRRVRQLVARARALLSRSSGA